MTSSKDGRLSEKPADEGRGAGGEPAARPAVKKDGGASPTAPASQAWARRQRSEPSEDGPDKAFIRAENEDDDGYDPYSDRRPSPEPLFERDPWD